MQCYIHEVIEYENETAKNSSLKAASALKARLRSSTHAVLTTLLRFTQETPPGMHRFVAHRSRKSAMMHEAWYRIFSLIYTTRVFLPRIPNS